MGSALGEAPFRGLPSFASPFFASASFAFASFAFASFAFASFALLFASDTSFVVFFVLRPIARTSFRTLRFSLFFPSLLFCACSLRLPSQFAIRFASELSFVGFASDTFALLSGSRICTVRVACARQACALHS
jgi:hypothetical protein